MFLENLSEKYNCTRSKPNLTFDQLRQFSILEDLPVVDLYRYVDVASTDSLIKVSLTVTGREIHSRYGSYIFYDSFCICAFTSLRDFGRTIIRTEKFIDKLAEAFSRTELDFEEFKEFSSRHYCLSNNPEKLKQSLDKEVTQHFLTSKLDIGVEFNENLCLLKIPYSLRVFDKNLELVEFALGLQKLIGEKIQSESL